ncbi:hypothetical protein, partial [Gardnerella greenwoodii]|uniref:hypothetical protein n=1 Tax=Gardnerella greenwoodii TaxID=2914925 RepID=UPI0039705A8A
AGNLIVPRFFIIPSKCSISASKQLQTPGNNTAFVVKNDESGNKRRGNIRHLWLETVIRIRRISHLPHGGD